VKQCPAYNYIHIMHRTTLRTFVEQEQDQLTYSFIKEWLTGCCICRPLFPKSKFTCCQPSHWPVNVANHPVRTSLMPVTTNTGCQSFQLDSDVYIKCIQQQLGYDMDRIWLGKESRSTSNPDQILACNPLLQSLVLISYLGYGEGSHNEWQW